MTSAQYRNMMGRHPQGMFKAKGKIPQAGRTYQSGVMNKTEAAYAALLDRKKAAGEVLCWHFEKVKLKLADNTFYTADFFVVMADGSLEVHEVKGGHWEDDARVKIKVAAEQFPWLTFCAARIVKNVWTYEQF